MKCLVSRWNASFVTIGRRSKQADFIVLLTYASSTQNQCRLCMVIFISFADLHTLFQVRLVGVCIQNIRIPTTDSFLLSID